MTDPPSPPAVRTLRVSDEPEPDTGVLVVPIHASTSSVVFASGMAAVGALLPSGRQSGDHVIVGTMGYPGVMELANGALARLGIGITRVDLTDPGELVEDLFRALD